MIRILTNTGEIARPWAKKHLQKVLKPGMKACVLAMSDFADVHDQKTWERDYGAGGIWKRAYEEPLRSFGIRDVTWISPYRESRDEMVKAIDEADLLILPGGAPDLFMKKIRRFGLKNVIRQKDLIWGISAGAMVQLGDYHITPDDDYDTFSWQTGLGILDFDLECHFTGSRHQRESMSRAMAEKGLETWALYEEGGLVIRDGEITVMGQVEHHRAADVCAGV